MTKQSSPEEQMNPPRRRKLRPGRFWVTGLFTLAMVGAPVVLSESPVNADSPLASATPTPSPTATTTPTSRPPGARVLLEQSAKAMRAARQVHSEAVLSAGRKALAKGIRIVADCDLQNQRERLHLEPIQPDTGEFIDWVITKDSDWFRTTQDPQWQQDTQADVDALIPILPVACPIGKGAYKTFVAKGVVLRNFGTAVVDGLPTWHIRIKSVQRKTRVSFSYYVDQSSLRWDRVVVDQEAPNPKYYADAHYSAYDQPIDIPTPVTGSGG